MVQVLARGSSPKPVPSVGAREGAEHHPKDTSSRSRLAQQLLTSFLRGLVNGKSVSLIPRAPTSEAGRLVTTNREFGPLGRYSALPTTRRRRDQLSRVR